MQTVYHDFHGKERTIQEMIKLEPEWAANVIQHLSKENDELRAELEKLKKQWAEDDRDIAVLEEENDHLRAELAAEAKLTGAPGYARFWRRQWKSRLLKPRK